MTHSIMGPARVLLLLALPVAGCANDPRKPDLPQGQATQGDTIGTCIAIASEQAKTLGQPTKGFCGGVIEFDGSGRITAPPNLVPRP